MNRIDLTPRLRLAAEYLTEHGHIKGSTGEPGGPACLTGAIRFCAPQTGDEHIIRQVLAMHGHAENWNDSPDVSTADVLSYLRTSAITDADLAEAFGPQWFEIVGMVRQTSTLTIDQARDLAAARAAARAAAWDAARAAAWALSVRDLIGQHGFTHAHYDTLTGPWRKTIGKLHPDDADLR